jgi:hypothetical protein
MANRAAIALAALLLTAAGPAEDFDPAFTLADPGALAAMQGELIASNADRYSRMTIPVTIEGQGPFRFMIDTGSQATVVSRALRDRLKLPTLGQATVVGMASRKQVELVRLNGLEFASRMFDSLHAPMLEGQHMGADGILGLDSLQDLRVLIDFRQQTIAVDDAKALGGDRGYEIVVRARNKKGRLIITDAEIDGVRTAVVLDTGSQGSLGNLALQQRLRTRKGSEVTATDVTGSTITGRLDTPRALRIGGRGSAGTLQLEGLSLIYSDAPAFAALGLRDKPAMVLGIEDLRMFDRVAIDFAERTVLFDLPRGTRDAASSGTRL